MSEVMVSYKTGSGVFIDCLSLVNDLKSEVRFLSGLIRHNVNLKYTIKPQILILNKLIRKYEGKLND